MPYTENAINILTTLKFGGVGRAWIHTHLKGGESDEEISQKLFDDKQILNKEDKNTFDEIFKLFQQRKEQVETELKLRIGETIQTTAYGDDDFPMHLLDIDSVPKGDKPVILFYRGDLNLLEPDRERVAVIGVLSPDEETEKTERRIVSSLVSEDIVIVSGLANGCDQIAHDQTVRERGKTIAILPCTLDHITPNSNRELAQHIIDTKGLLITEYHEEPTGKHGLTGRYIKRDRLQALFSDCVLLAASYVPNHKGLDSGSRHAMEKAQKYGIPRAVIYEADKHSASEMYALNRTILKNDSSVISIKTDEDSITQSVDKIKRKIEKRKGKEECPMLLL